MEGMLHELELSFLVLVDSYHLFLNLCYILHTVEYNQELSLFCLWSSVVLRYTQICILDMDIKSSDRQCTQNTLTSKHFVIFYNNIQDMSFSHLQHRDPADSPSI